MNNEEEWAFKDTRQIIHIGDFKKNKMKKGTLRKVRRSWLLLKEVYKYFF